MYTHGTKAGFAALQQVVLALEENWGGKTQWMKLSEIARYWAARHLTRITSMGHEHVLQAPFACPQFTLRVPYSLQRPPLVNTLSGPQELRKASSRAELSSGTWYPDSDSAMLCFDLPRGETKISTP
jgi:hypothetical protein